MYRSSIASAWLQVNSEQYVKIERDVGGVFAGWRRSRTMKTATSVMFE